MSARAALFQRFSFGCVIFRSYSDEVILIRVEKETTV